MRIVFMGTPEFAVPTLEEIVKSGHDVCCVVTQPDKMRGRGFKVSYSAVKECALKYGIPVEQPIRIKKDTELIERLNKMKPDLIVVVAFGQLLSQEILSIPKYGCINVHASLLPKYRGAAPINWAIINGENITGVTTMMMDVGLDTGDMLLKESIDIGSETTADELHDRLMIIGAKLLIKTVNMLSDGTLHREKQDDSKFTYAPMLSRDTGKIDWSKSSLEIKNLIRGLNSWPGAYSSLGGNKLKIWNAEIENEIEGQPGYVWKVDKEGIHVYTGNGGIVIKEIQAENGKKINAYAYTLGHPVNPKSIFE